MSRPAVSSAGRTSLTPFQQHVLSIPEDFDVFLGGGRGGGKTVVLAQIAMRAAEQYGAQARMLYLRQSYPGVVDFETETRLLFGEVYGDDARFNAGSRIWRFPTGATLEIGQLEDLGDFRKYQGRNFCLILIDEAGQWPTLSTLELLRSCLRAPAGVPCRMVLAANPGGPGHAELARRFVLTRQPWVPFADEASGRTWVYAPSLYVDNPHLDQDSYRQQLEASTAADPDLRKAWIAGDWTIARGAFFSDVISDRCAIDAELWRPDSETFRQWRAQQYRAPELLLAYDHGTAAPAVCYVAARSNGWIGPDCRHYPNGSILLLDEWHSCEPGSLTRGLPLVVSRIADEIKAMSAEWEMDPSGPADDALWGRTGHDAGSIADEFRRFDVHFEPAGKGDRASGWSLMRQMLSDAGVAGRPGLYVSRRCSYWWSTVPTLPRDPRRPSDLDSRSADHAADACRYALCRENRTATTVELLF